MPRQKQNVPAGQIPGEEIFEDDSTAVLVPPVTMDPATVDKWKRSGTWGSAEPEEPIQQREPELESKPEPAPQVPPAVDTRPGCPSCGSKALGIAGGMRHCN